MNLATLRNWWMTWFCGPVLLREKAEWPPYSTRDLGLPVRIRNLLAGANIHTVSELASLRVSDLRRIKGLGDVYCAEIERVMVERGLWR